MCGARISVRPAYDDQIECADIAADKVFTRRHLGKPAKRRSVRDRSGSSNTVLLHEGLEELAHSRRLFVAPPSIGINGKASGQLCYYKFGNAIPQWNTLEIGAGALRQQYRGLEGGFHGRDILGWYQNRLHHQLPVVANERSSKAAKTAPTG